MNSNESSSSYTPVPVPVVQLGKRKRDEPEEEEEKDKGQPEEGPAKRVKSNPIELVDNHYTFWCPWCDGGVQVDQTQINCKIFRHGAFKNNGQQIGQHLPHNEAQNLVKDQQINACGHQFWFDGTQVHKLIQCPACNVSFDCESFGLALQVSHSLQHTGSSSCNKNLYFDGTFVQIT